MASSNQKLPPVPKIPADQRHRCTKPWIEAVCHLRTGTEFETDYEITDIESMGKGHCGEVLPCRYKPTSENRAVKRSVNDARVKRLLSNELCIVERIGSHPNFIRYFAVYETVDNIYIVMELAARSLRDAFNKDFMYQNKHIHPDILNELTREFLDALCYLHHLGIVHRDLKLSNIICKSANSLIPIALIDFDLSFMVEDGHEVVIDTPCGNLMTYAPETVRRVMDRLVECKPGLFEALPYGEYGNPAQDNFTTDTKIDVYGFGVCIFLLCTAYAPFGRLGRDDCCPNHANVPNKNCFICLERVLRSQKHQQIFDYPEVSQRLQRYGPNMMRLVRDSMIFDAQQRPKAIELYQSCTWIHNAAQQELVEQALSLTNSAQIFRSRTIDVVGFSASPNSQAPTNPSERGDGGIPSHRVPEVLHNIEMQSVPN